MEIGSRKKERERERDCLYVFSLWHNDIITGTAAEYHRRIYTTHIYTMLVFLLSKEAIYRVQVFDDRDFTRVTRERNATNRSNEATQLFNHNAILGSDRLIIVEACPSRE